MSGLSPEEDSDGVIEVKSGGSVPWHRRQYAYMARAVRKKVSMLTEAPKGDGDGDGEISGDIADADGERYGVTDFRSIARWKFAARPFLATEEQAKMTIGILHVKVIEARGLMASDMSGKSDPYVKLSLTGRHLSHGQEWSEGLRISERTEMVKCSLGPSWNEEFSLPVRRAGAVLRVEVWDWDRSSTDDPLGHFEVKVGEELLSKKPMDMWYVLNAPDNMELAAPTLSKRRSSARPPEGFQQKEGEAKDGIGDEAEVSLHNGVDEEDTESESSAEDVTTAEEGWNARWSDLRLGVGSSAFARALQWKSSLGASNDDSADGLKHTHGPDEQSRFCEACIDFRRKTFGEVRLELRFEFDEFAETCSHIWPEEPRVSPVVPFSPNLVYFKAMLLWELAQPYLKLMQGAYAVVYWVFPWTSLLCLAAIVVMLLQPLILAVAFNGGLLAIVVSSYLQHTLERPGITSSSSPGIYSGGPRDYPINSAEDDLDLSAQGAASGDAGIMDLFPPGATDESTSGQDLYESADIENSGTPLADGGGQGTRDCKKATAAGKSGSKGGKGGRPPLLHPQHTAGDRELEELCGRVSSSKKLPGMVEGVGKRIFPTDGPFIQKQVETMITVLVKVRRRFQPLEAMPLVMMVFAIMTNACLQLRLRFNLYLLVLCVTLFSYTYYIRRGRALVMGIGEAMRCRQVRRALSKPSNPPPREVPEVPEVEEPGSPGSDSAPLSPSPGRARRGALLPGDGVMPKHLLFAPPGTTPAQESPPRSCTGSNEEDDARQQRGNPVGGVVSINAGGSSSFQEALTTMKAGGIGFGRNIFGRSLSTPERTTGSIFPTAVAPSPSTVAPAHEGVTEMEEGVSPSHPRASKEAREATVLTGASSETSSCGGEDGSSTQHYGSVEGKQPRAKAHKWMGSSRMARLREKLRGDDQAYGSIAEEEEDDDDVGEGESREWRKRVSKWYGNR